MSEETFTRTIMGRFDAAQQRQCNHELGPEEPCEECPFEAGVHALDFERSECARAVCACAPDKNGAPHHYERDCSCPCHLILDRSRNEPRKQRTPEERSVQPDPNLYERMAAPCETQAAAQAALDDFMTRVRRVREESRVPEVVVVMAAHHKESDKMAINSFAPGSSGAAPLLGAVAFNLYAKPQIDEAKRLEKIAQMARSE